MKKTIALFMTFILLLTGNFMSSSAEGAAERNEQSPSEETKIAPELMEKIEKYGDTDQIEAYIILYDIDYDSVMNELKASYPRQYDEYIKAKESDIAEGMRQSVQGDVDLKDSYDESKYVDPINDDLLQEAIELKRHIYERCYNAYNKAFTDKYIESKNQIFVSEYAPMIIAKVTKQDIQVLLQDENVAYIDEFLNEEYVPSLSIANQTTKVSYVRDTCGDKGSGVKIGLIEANNAVPNTSATGLGSASITCYTTSTTITNVHATQMAQVIVGSTNGVAPNASLYCRGITNTSTLYSAIEWAISRGVNVINLSLGGDDPSNWGVYDWDAKWIDHIALQHDVHVVISAGNNGGLISSPGMAYNGITVGGYNVNSTVTDNDDYLYSNSSYEESSTTNRAEKPNLIAPGASLTIENYQGVEGTSSAAAQVTGIIAQLCGHSSGLKTKQTAMGAILAASSFMKVQGTSGSGVRGDTFASSVRINEQISEYEGAGKVNAQAARSILLSGNYWGSAVATSNLPYTKTVYISSTSNSLTRVGVFWLMRNSVSGSHALNDATVGTFTDLDVRVYDPNGTLVGSSLTAYSNFEIVQFVPATSGNYTIKVSKSGTNTSTLENIGIAVW